jgi:N-acetylglutamate synthase-like GNAT family acetyltransferase
MEISVIPAHHILEEITDFYKTHARAAKVTASDELVVAYADQKFIGSVRLCNEDGVYTLRSMQVAKDHQRRGLGLEILNRFRQRIEEKNISEVYCIPYVHLEEFYGNIGFKKIEDTQAPEFLQERIAEMRQRNPDKEFILMKLTITPDVSDLLQ